MTIECPSVVHPDSVAQHREIAARQGRAAERLVTARVQANEPMVLDIVDQKAAPTTSGAVYRQNFK